MEGLTMTYLEIKNQNSNIEIVDKNLITKLYQEAKSIKDYEDLNDIQESQVDLSGNLQVDKAYGDEVNWLNNTFTNLQITITTSRYIHINDSTFEQACINYWGDGTGVTESTIQNVTTLDNWKFSERATSLSNNNIDITTINTIDLSGFTNLVNIGCSAFYGCFNVRNVILPNGLKRISYNDGGGQWGGCFRECRNLSTIQLPDTLEEIGDRCFMNCSNLTSIQLPRNIKYIGSGPTKNQEWGVFFDTGLTSITIPDGTLVIGDAAFRGCPLTGTIVIPGSVQLVDKSAFASNAGGCTFILEEGSQPLALPEHNMSNSQPDLSLFTSTSVGTHAANAVIFKRTISEIGGKALMMHDNIKYLFKQTTPPTVASGTEITFSWKTSGTVYVEDDYVNTWKAAPGFSDISDLIQPLSTAPSDLRALLNSTSS